jgi:hypothetical protein
MELQFPIGTDRGLATSSDSGGRGSALYGGGGGQLMSYSA